ncbi:PhnD/SsuA/transferrin family substrate-binding protein [Ornithinimicrobium pratense]|uniref:PhnD/SsuA/transferrin family substrate-binding protein n=1 Tax=Ornithinimicrobium pratense TaxID=2593973 RepID=A0A5J6V6F5_9MICO|nr:PhnD/SsuA/transferrin family substrate-binding protein [Ornithinimicrobium pratense]QFG68706.1 PhnD/SsuA/transferrin family substrate-binding protein [Ornithinimicrobium pratense]
MRLNILSRQALAAAAAASLLTLAACGGEDDTTAEAAVGDDGAVCGTEPLRFSDTGVEGLEELRVEFEDFRVALEEATDLDVDFQPMSSRTAAATALEYDDLDVLLTGPTEYVVLKAEADAIPLVGVTRQEYRPAIYVRADSDAQSIEDLRGAQLITKEVGSTAGHLGPLEMVDAAGVDPNSNELDVVPLSGTHLAAFASGDGDALGSGIDDLGELEELMGEGNVRVLAEGNDLPNDLFVAREGLGQDCADYLRETLVENQDVLIEAIVSTGENDKYDRSEFVAASDSDYDPIRRAFVAAGFPEFTDLPDDDE